MMSTDTPFFSVLVPALNEVHHVERCLESLLAQMSPEDGEVLLIDGGSTDGTLAIVERLVGLHPALRLVPNPGRLQSFGCNLGVRLADPRSSVIIRADAHAFYPPDFLALCLAALRANNATSVVVPMRTRGEASAQRGIAAAQNSVLGNGGSRHRRSGASGYVDHGHHAAFNRHFYEALGGYDATFTHNEDAELDIRATAAGGRIWLCSEAAIEYFPRSSLTGLAKQYFRHGAGRARTILKHRLRPRPRQLLPVAILGSGILAVGGLCQPLLAAPFLTYVGICVAWSGWLAIHRRDGALLAAGPALLVMHLAWGTGFVRTILRRQKYAVGGDRKPAVRSFFTSIQ